MISTHNVNMPPAIQKDSSTKPPAGEDSDLTIDMTNGQSLVKQGMERLDNGCHDFAIRGDVSELDLKKKPQLIKALGLIRQRLINKGSDANLIGQIELLIPKLTA